MNSGPLRSLAAYKAKHQRHGEQSMREQQPRTSTTASCAEKASVSLDENTSPAIGKQRPAKLANVRRVSSPFKPAIPTPCNIEPDIMQYLPPQEHSVAVAGSPLVSRLPTLRSFGEAFVKQFLMLDHDDYSIMFSGCVLLSYANTMALSGSGTKTILLELKGQVISRISAKIESSDGLLSPRCLIAILALGAPLVCLVSQDLPHSLSIWEYINVSQYANYLCCQSSADRAQKGLDERKVHWQALGNMFSKINGSFRDEDSLSLLLYLSHYMDL
jgi:hypothetical protein